MKKLRIINCPCLVSETAEEIKEYIRGLYQNKIGGYSVGINAEKVVMYNRFEDVKEIIEKCVLPTIDGEGVPWGIRLIYKKTVSKVDLPVAALELANSMKLRVFFLGSKEEYNKTAVENVRIRYPDIVIAGRHHGYFKDDDYIKNVLLKTNPQMVLMALGSPKQEKLSMKLHPFLMDTIFICGGGALNVLADVKKRPPKRIIKSKFFPIEWFYILIRDPNIKRFKRELALPAYFFLVLRDMIKIRVLKINC
jgi:N-acetylglucosaminyldiphosphoundecaprenol N-acetyl-beta-D-mannosaminyltransferase